MLETFSNRGPIMTDCFCVLSTSQAIAFFNLLSLPVNGGVPGVDARRIFLKRFFLCMGVSFSLTFASDPGLTLMLFFATVLM